MVGANAFQNQGLIYMVYASAAGLRRRSRHDLEGGTGLDGRHIAAPPRASVEAAVIEAAHATLRHASAQEVSLAGWRDEGPR